MKDICDKSKTSEISRTIDVNKISMIKGINKIYNSNEISKIS